MRILIDIGHPAHVHLYKNLYFELIKKGHKVYITVRDIKSAVDLLESYDIPYVKLGSKSDGILKKGIEQLKFDYLLFKMFKKYKINLAVGAPFNIAHASKFINTNSILLDDDDDEVQPLMTKFGHPFADTVLSPVAVRDHRKVKSALLYSGYHELAYLHPTYFIPDHTVLKDAGLSKNEKYFVLRFNVFKAHHDIGIKGLSLEQKLTLIALLEQHGKIFITTEREIEPELKKYQFKLPSEKIHNFLFFATMFIGDSQTMTSEAAILGTPAVKCNSFASRLSIPNELEKKYGLCYSFLPSDFNLMINKIQKLLSMPNIEAEWKKRRQKMLSEKIDVTAFLVWFVENYPDSVRIMKENPDYQWYFR